MTRLDILTAVARYELSHSTKPDTLYITEAQWNDLMEEPLRGVTCADLTLKGPTRVYLGMEVEFIPRGDLRVTHHSNK